jgi:hypothetical protein
MKKISLALCFIMIAVNVFCEEWEFIVIRDTPIRWNLRPNEVVRVLNEGKKIISSGSALFSNRVNGESLPTMGFLPDNEFPWVTRGHFIDVRDVVPANTTALFGYDILADRNNILVSYTVDVLRSGNRETMFLYETHFRDRPYRSCDAYLRDIYWYEEFYSNDARFFVFNSMLGFGYRWQLIAHNIEKTEHGYIVRCKNSSGNHNRMAAGVVIIPKLDWSLTEGKQYFYLLIHIDGDYIDLYIDSVENKLGTFVNVSDEFVYQFDRLINTNTVDLSRITTWPRRADGTMDFPPPVVSSNAPAQQVVDESIEITYDVEDQESAVVQNDTSASSMPLWVWLAIIGGVFAAGVVVIVLKRKG